LAGQNESNVDLPTVLGIAVVAYTLTNVVHEGGGHGTACLLVGGKPTVLNAIFLSCNGAQGIGQRVLAMGGSVANVALAIPTGLAVRFLRGSPGPNHYFLWLLFALNVLMPSGYLLFSGVSGFGDWAVVIQGLAPALLYRALVAAAGGALYFMVVPKLLLPGLDLYLGRDPDARPDRARRLALAPYLAGGITYVVAGLFNPLSPWLILFSAAAASFGGTCWLAYYPGGSDDRRATAAARGAPGVVAGIPRRTGWIVAGALALVGFVFLLGPGLRL
jgi:hypothetical protein